MRRTPFATALGLVVLLAVAGAGCATKTVAPPPADQPPAPSTPGLAVERFAWGLNHKDIEVVRRLLTDDFQFTSAGTDSAGNPNRNPSGNPHDRSWFLAALAALADSSGSVSVLLDQNLLALPDARPGKDPRFHTQVRTSIDVKVLLAGEGGSLETTGNLLCFATRGDSAAIPSELIGLGFKPDSTRWWLDRMDDETLQGARLPSATDPSRNITLGLVLEYFYSLVAH